MRVFISHTSIDATFAARLAEELQSAGFTVWSPDSVLPGDNWALQSGRALEESDVMVALFRKGAPGSETVQKDVQFALTSGSYRGRVVPVLVDFAAAQAGNDVPWVLLRMDPLWLNGSSPDFHAVVKRIEKVSQTGTHASA
ncbi:MAG: toll/interleukin-1 receptor domain-containing protein [Pirellulales bacterium]